jgi:hypothetical protein
MMAMAGAGAATAGVTLQVGDAASGVVASTGRPCGVAVVVAGKRLATVNAGVVPVVTGRGAGAATAGVTLGAGGASFGVVASTGAPCVVAAVVVGERLVAASASVVAGRLAGPTVGCTGAVPGMAAVFTDGVVVVVVGLRVGSGVAHAASTVTGGATLACGAPLRW